MAGTNLQSPVSATLNAIMCDATGLILTGTCTGVPPTTAATFSHGALITQTDTATGATALWENVGSTAVPSFNLVGTVNPGEIVVSNNQSFLDNNGNNAFTFGVVASAVNTVKVSNSATTNDVSLVVVGDTAVSGITMTGKAGGAATVAGGKSAIAGGAGNTSGAGGVSTVTGGAGGATGAGGAAAVTGGAGGATSGSGGSASLIGGAGTAGNAVGGDAIIAAGASNGSGVAGVAYVRSPLAKKLIATAMTDTATISVANILSGTINATPTAAATYTMPTGAVIAAALPTTFVTGDSLDFAIVNIATTAGFDITVATAASGTTMFGGLEVSSNNAVTDRSSGIFRLICTGSATYDIYRIA